MAGRMVNLGQVGFGLVADTDQLKASLELLKAFGREVDRLSKQTSESSQAMFKKFAPMEGTLTRMQTSTEQTIRKMQQLGATDKDIKKVEDAFRRAHDEVIKFAEDISPNRIQRATIGLSAIQNRALAEAQTAKKLRDEELRATQLANREMDRQHTQALSMNRRFDEDRIRANTRFAQYLAKERDIQQKEVNRAHGIALRDIERAEADKIRVMSRFAQQETALRQRTIAENNRLMLANNRQATAVSTLGARAGAAGIDPRFMAQTQAALGVFQATSLQDPTARTQAYIGLRNAMAATHAEILKVNGGTSKFATGLRDLERAAILALGPLSGIGARLAVLSALFDASSFKMAAIIAGVTGAAAALAFIGVASVRATMDMQRFEAVLTASTGAAALAEDEYKKVEAIANRWGFAVQKLVDPYAKFTTAARMSNLSLDDQKLAFEAVTVSSRAMHLNAERTNLVFLAFEQMLSKGTVTMEELRRQLGDLLPGAFAIAAKSMGMTQAAFSQAVTNGEVLASDLIPKLSAALLTVFGPSAEVAAKNLQAEMERFRTSLFNVQNAFDRTTNTTKIFTAFVVSATSAMESLARSMDVVIGSVGALAGAGGMLILIANLGRVTAAVGATVFALSKLKDAITGFTLAGAAATLATGGVLGVLLKIVAVIGAAIAGFTLMRPAQNDVIEGFEEWIKKGNDWIAIQEKIGSADKLTTQLMKEGAATRLRAVNSEMMRIEATLNKKVEIQKRTDEILFGANIEAMRRRRAQGKTSEDAETTELRQRLETLKQLQQDFTNQLQNFGALPIDPEDNTTPATTAWQNFTKRFKDQLREYEFLQKELVAAQQGDPDAMRSARAMREALDFIASMPEKAKDKGSLDPLIASLGKMGFAGKNGADGLTFLTHQLHAMFTAMDKGKKDLNELEALPKKLETAGKGIRDLFQDLEDRRVAATSANPEQLQQQRALERHVTDLRDKLNELGLDQEKVNFLVDDYRKKWASVQGAEDESKRIKNLRQDLERLNNSLGDKTVRAEEQFRDRIKLISEGFAQGEITVQEAARMTNLAHDDLNRQMLDRTTVFGRQVKEVFRDMERTASRAIAEIVVKGKFDFRDLFETIAMHIAEFAAQMAIIAPIMRGLFGNMYDSRAASGSGLLESFVRNLGGMGPGIQTGPNVGAGFTQSAFTGSEIFPGFASGGSFTVPGSGGVDSQFVGFHATPGERVTVETPQQQRGNGNIQVVIHNNTGVPVEATTSQSRVEGDVLIFDLVLRHLSKNSRARQQLRGMLGEPQH